ncbi:transmembrane protein 50B [Onthophagus taurus]|uniref:transmembrane protein 50B n=1 Tax=Onthophagus taurus TaxID=166361 RepID=UPI000C2077A0|nr:transmembrane protein 50B [Onthophagus taurus]
MANCFENLNIPTCVWFEGGEKRNAVASILAGFLFFLGWWLIIDAASVDGGITVGYHICGIFGTLSLIIVNSISNSQIRGDAYEGGCMGSRGAKIVLFIGFVMGFGSVIAACLILFANFVNKEVKQWPGVGLFLQNALIFIASLIYKFGRSDDQWG